MTHQHHQVLASLHLFLFLTELDMAEVCFFVKHYFVFILGDSIFKEFSVAVTVSFHCFNMRINHYLQATLNNDNAALNKKQENYHSAYRIYKVGSRNASGDC